MPKKLVAVLYKSIASIVLVSTLSISQNISANEVISGCFVAKEDCEALHSIRKHTNPENIRLKPFSLYAVTGKNKIAATHYQITIPESKVSQRWVPVSCGNYVSNCRLLPPTQSVTTDSKPQYLLALSWEPSFCETHRQKTECKTMTADRYDARNLSLHGLWPQPRNNAYCNVDSTTKAIDRRKRWDLLEPLALSANTRSELAKVMPGYASNLHRHEWIKHGTCYGTSAELYYQHSIKLTKDINQSLVGYLLANNIGQSISADDIKDAFDQTYGKGSGNKVNMRCDNKGRLSELWINLSGKITNSSTLASLLSNAPVANNNCRVGVVDPAN